MAHVETIFIKDDGKTWCKVKLKPAGYVDLEFDMPPDFYSSVVKIAQHAADLHEQQMRAQILADGAEGEKS